MIGPLRGRSAKEVATRLRQAASARLDRAGVGQASRLPGDDVFLRRLQPASPTPAALLEGFRTRDVGRVLPALADPASTIDRVRERWPARVTDLVERADRLRHGRFDLLGYGGLEFGEPVDWHLDPVSGRRAPRAHWSRLDPLDAEVVGDHKVIWELNRHQHLPVLARAWLATGDARHAGLLVDHLSSWMRENEPKRGINWTSSLELAYRSIAWIWALNLIRGSEQLSPALFLSVLKYLWLQGRHVEAHLSTYYSPNTHLTGEALGLLYLGTLMPDLPDATRWRRLGWRILIDQVDRHVLPDGTYFERASYYHRYTVDIYTHALLLGRANGAPAADLSRVERALRRLLHHLACLTRPDGASPLLGDDDGGHLWFPEPGRLDDFRPALSTGAALFGRPDLAYVAGGAHEETLWLLGPAGLRALDSLEPTPPASDSAGFEDGGYYVMRDGWARHASHMVVDAGPLGVMNCGHAHADALSFELTVRGQPVIVDPGTFSYADAAARDAFRATAAHNTITVSDAGSSEPGTAFQWRSRADGRVERWLPAERFDFLSALHQGFARLAPPGEHRREIFFARGEWWLVRDSLRLDGRRPGALSFQLAPDVAIVETTDGARLLDPAGADLLQAYVWGPDGRPLRGRVEAGRVSRAYGSARPAHRWVIRQDPAPAAFWTLLIPATSRIGVAAVAEGDGLRVEFEHAGVRHRVRAGDGARDQHDGLDTDAEWLWLRQVAGDPDVDIVALAASRLTLDGRALLAADRRLERFEARARRNGPVPGADEHGIHTRPEPGSGVR